MEAKLEGYSKALGGFGWRSELSSSSDGERLAAIGQTAGMVGHDIRNPLQAITSEVYLAKNRIGFDI